MMTINRHTIAFWRLVVIGVAGVTAVLALFSAIVHADSGAPAAASAGVNWTAIAAWAALGLSLASGILHIIAPLTRTTADDRLRDIVDEALGIARGQTPAPPKVPPSAAVMLLIMLMGPMVGCATVRPVVEAAKTTAIACAKQEALPILGLAAELAVQAALAAVGSGRIDWDSIEATAYARGKIVGGCALARFVAELGKAPKPATTVRSLLAPPDPAADGEAALARLSVRFGGATWQ